MFSALIIEDNLRIQEELENSVEKLGVDVVGKVSCEEDAKAVITENNPDVIFCDINLPDFNGFSFAEQLKLIYPSIEVVFITGYTEFAHKAFEIQAIDYLTKPFSYERLKECVKRLHSHFNKEKNQKSMQLDLLPIKSNKGINFLETNNIIYISSEGKFSTIISIDSGKYKEIKTSETLKSIEERLDPNRFARTHKSFIVNLSQVNRIEPSGQTNLIFFKSCSDMAYLSKNYMLTLYKKLNFR
ncbi:MULTISPECIES: LytR/AlgR family response regulator transcription factor [Priestia]|uniref:Response regulator n=1 Tax=Priestia megaterium TaxID=1404 RepID=A0A6M6DMT6_PRIMG|nr:MULTISPECIES: LytTR family DNA-binding domain-containing protein [Priestia]MBX9971007.1 response regulator transcription factor [Priestia aryabhattai]QJX74666.1 response regulator [Priestia megaterium]